MRKTSNMTTNSNGESATANSITGILANSLSDWRLQCSSRAGFNQSTNCLNRERTIDSSSCAAVCLFFSAGIRPSCQFRSILVDKQHWCFQVEDNGAG